MSKAADIGKVSAKGSFHVLWGLVVSTVISAVGSIFIARLLGSELYGLYGIALAAPSLITIFRDWGITSAMIRYSAQYRTENRAKEIRSVIMTGLVFEIIMGIALSILSFLLSDYLAVVLYDRPTIVPLIQIASFSILASALIGTATAVFTGSDRMELNSIVLIVEATVKTALIIVLVILGLGTTGAVIGFTVSAMMAGLVGVLFIMIVYKRLPKPEMLKLEMKAYFKEMLKYGVPLSISTILAGFLTQYYGFILPIYVTDNMYGNLRIAQNFVILIGFVATPITIVLFPAFSKLNAERDNETLKNVFQYSVKYASLLVVPVAYLVMALSGPAVSTLFGTSYETAQLFLALLTITYLYTAAGNLSIGNVFISQGQTKLILILAIISAAIGFPLGTVLIMMYGVVGLIIATLTSGIPTLFLALYWLKKHYDLTVDWLSSAKILIASSVTAATTYFAVSQIAFSSWIKLLVGVVIFVLVFIPAVLFSRAITRPDLYNLGGMASGLGSLGRIVTRILNLIEKLMSLLRL